MTNADGSNFASASLLRHIVRGVIGFGGMVGALVLLPVVGWVSLLLLPIGLLALRGCPMCWVIGLVETVSRGRMRRDCVDGQCRLVGGASALGVEDEQAAAGR
jgi:hypothetical protein